MGSVYLAKSCLYQGRPVTVLDHNWRVAEMSRRFGEALGIGEAAFFTSLFHDFGKYGPLFQAVLEGRQTHVDHALPGAAFLQEYLLAPCAAVQVAAGHHDGLMNHTELEPYIKSVLTDRDMQDGPYGERPSFCGRDEFQRAMVGFCGELKSRLDVLKTPVWPYEPDEAWPLWKVQLFTMMTVRMLFSCQVDADFTMSAVEAGDMDVSRHDTLDAAKCLARLAGRRAGIKNGSTSVSGVNRVRDEVYEACGRAGDDVSRRFLTLTAPTGSGKTLGMLHFALRRMLADDSKKRIIFVLPFLTLINQSAKDICDAIPGTIIDNSVFEYDNKTDRLLSETWDASCVVTTTVQFFGSLFSHRTKDCRKLHNMANAVIVFDEIQALPLPVSRLAMQTLHWLCREFNSDILLSTATQPSYRMLPGLDFECSEVISDPVRLFTDIGCKDLRVRNGYVRLDGIALETGNLDNVCVVCNLRRHAMQVFKNWTGMGIENCYLLSSDLCPAHRDDVIMDIKRLQSKGETAHVVATQCIEAGVDLDFKYLYRALGPLVSILQAAGRQDRNGRYPDGYTVVFELEQENGKRMYPGEDYERQALLVKALLASGHDLRDLDTIGEYYRRLFAGRDLEPGKLMAALESGDYRNFEKESRLIKNGGVRVVVPYGNSPAYNAVLDAVLSGHASKSVLAGIGPVSVSCYDVKSVQEHCGEIIIGHGMHERHTGVDSLSWDFVSNPRCTANNSAVAERMWEAKSRVTTGPRQAPCFSYGATDGPRTSGASGGRLSVFGGSTY